MNENINASSSITSSSISNSPTTSFVVKDSPLSSSTRNYPITSSDDTDSSPNHQVIIGLVFNVIVLAIAIYYIIRKLPYYFKYFGYITFNDYIIGFSCASLFFIVCGLWEILTYKKYKSASGSMKIDQAVKFFGIINFIISGIFIIYVILFIIFKSKNKEILLENDKILNNFRVVINKYIERENKYNPVQIEQIYDNLNKLSKKDGFGNIIKQFNIEGEKLLDKILNNQVI